MKVFPLLDTGQNFNWKKGGIVKIILIYITFFPLCECIINSSGTSEDEQPFLYDNITDFNSNVSNSVSPQQHLQPQIEPSIVHQSFIQSYCGPNLNSMSPDQISSYVVLLQIATSKYATGEPLVKTHTDFLSQNLYIANTAEGVCHLSYNQLFMFPTTSPTSLRRLSSTTNATRTTTMELRVKFNMTWSSTLIKIEYNQYVNNFTTFMNNATTKNIWVEQLNQLGVLVEDASNIRISLKIPTPAPTYSPTPEPSIIDDRNFTIIIIFISISVVTLIALIIMFSGKCHINKILCKKDEPGNASSDDDINLGEDFFPEIMENTIIIENSNKIYTDRSEGCLVEESKTEYSSDDMNIVIPIANNLSATTYANERSLQNIQQQQQDLFEFELDQYKTANMSTTTCANELFEDVLDHYKNPNLEILRAKIQSYICTSEEMISHAITCVLLMSGEDCLFEIDKIGGKSANTNEFEVEANMLYRTNDWLKKNHSCSAIERNEFAQEVLQQMILLCVIHKTISIGSSIRIIHECCALLRMELKRGLSGRTVIITGMRKNVMLNDVIASFRVFGIIENIALAPISRDFGFVRYRYEYVPTIVIQKFRKNEIVVQDVAVVVRILSSPVIRSQNDKHSDNNNTGNMNLYWHSLNDTNNTLNMRQDRNNDYNNSNINDDDDCMHILSSNSSSNRSLSMSYHNNSILRKSTSWPRLELKDDLLQDSLNSSSSEVHLMRQMSIFNPYI